jgi:hypothetical protein
MKHAVETGSVAVINMPGLLKIGSGIQKLIGGGEAQEQRLPDRQHGDHISILSFFQNKESGIKMKINV